MTTEIKATGVTIAPEPQIERSQTDQKGHHRKPTGWAPSASAPAEPLTSNPVDLESGVRVSTHRQRAASILTNREAQDGRQTYEEVQGIVSRHGPDDYRTILLGSLQNLLGSLVLGIISVGGINVLQDPLDQTIIPLYNIINRLVIALQFGFGLLVAGHTFSAGAFNPAVIQTQYTSGQITAKQAAADVVATFAGWLSAAGLMSAIRGELGGTLTVQPGHTVGESWGAEIVLSAIFVYSIMQLILMKPVSNQSLLILFGVITGIHLVGIPINGCGINQARALATAVVNRDFGQGSVFASYMVGPIFGSLLADITIRAQKYLQADTVPQELVDPEARGGRALVARERIAE